MADVEFFRTQMGQRFYTSTMPDIAKALGRIAEGLAPRSTFTPDELQLLIRAAAWFIENNPDVGPEQYKQLRPLEVKLRGMLSKEVP